MTSRPTFNLRLRAYTPLGDPGKIIPDLGITLVSSPDGPTLSATVTTVVYGSLPDDLEVAVEVWADSIGAWTEGRDSRFVILGQQHDDRDVTGVVTITGIGLMQWLTSKAALAGVTPYQDAGNVEAAATGTGISVSGHTFTWASHILGTGDRVRITDSGKSKDLSKGAVYFVRNPSGSTFQLSHTATGAIKSFGSSHTIKMERVRTRIVNLNGHKFAKNQAISVWDATANQALTNGSQYYVVNPTASTIQVATKPGGIPVELVADALTVYRYLDGARQFKSQTPGQIIGDSFLEARDRGWGQDASGNDQVFHSWTNAGDSNSLAWPARVDDPTITGVSVSFQPGTPLWDQIRFMLDNGWAEFASHGRTLDLFAPNTGTDYGTTANQRRIGTVAQQLPITKDLTDYRTAETVRGDGPVENTVTDGRSPWGRLEIYTTAAGVGSAKHAKSYAQGDLTKYSTPAIGYQVVEAAQEAAYLPILDYQRGDWVMVQVKGTWTRLRVTQWTLQKNTDGTATVTVLLEKKKRSILHKVAHASRRANGGRAATATSTTPHESDKRKAAKPSTVTVQARTVHAADASTKSTVTAKWLPVTTDEDGDDLTGAAYEVHVRTEGEQVGKAVAKTKGTSADLSGYTAGQTIAVSVRAQSSTGEWGELTDEVEYVVDSPENLLDAPTTPVVVSTLGSVTVTWDGNLVDAIDGAIPPHAGFAFVQVQRSADNGTTWATETQTLPATGTVTDLGLNVGASYSYRLIAVDSIGRQSAPSAVASCSVVGIDVAQINAGFKKSMDDVAAVSSNAQSVANQSAATAGTALDTANSASTAASNALTTANGKNTVHYSAAAPSSSGAVAGDLWFQVDASNRIIGQWSWVVTSGTGAWVTNTLTGSVLAAGAVDTAQLSTTVAQSITTAQSTASNAATAASNAQTSANGKTSVTYSTVPVSGNGKTSGDIWWQVDSSSGAIVAWWIWNGTAWTAQNLAATMIPNLDAGKISTGFLAAARIQAGTITGDKLVANSIGAAQIAAGTITGDRLVANTITAGQIAAATITATQLAAGTITSASGVIGALDAGAITTGTLSAARISARSISASQVAVADFTNLFPSPHFDAVGGGSWFGSSTSSGVYLPTDVPVGNAWTMGDRDNISSYVFPVKAGDSFYIEYTARQLRGTIPISGLLWLYTATGGQDAGGAWFSSSVYAMHPPQVQIADLGNGWKRYSSKFTLPAGWTTVAQAALYFQIDQSASATTTSWAVADVLVRRAANASLIVDGAIIAGKLAAGAIDGMLITGGTIRTASTASTSGGVILDPSGITGYNSSGAATFRVDNAGNTSMTGTVNATGGAITGTLDVKGNLSVSSGSITSKSGTANAFMGNGYLAVNDTSSGNSVLTGNGLSVSGGTVVLQNDGGGSGILTTQYSSLRLLGHSSGGGGDLTLDNDGSPRVWSNAIRNRTYANASADVTASNASVTNGLLCITAQGTIGMMTGNLFTPTGYSTAVSGRSASIGTDGKIGYTSSARRTKNLHNHVRMDDASLEVWLKLPTWRYDYKNDPTHAVQYGMVAEEVHDAGLTHLVYYNEQDGETKGQIDGLAYEKMPVMNRMAMSRLYERLVAAETKLARLEARA